MRAPNSSFYPICDLFPGYNSHVAFDDTADRKSTIWVYDIMPDWDYMTHYMEIDTAKPRNQVNRWLFNWCTHHAWSVQKVSGWINTEHQRTNIKNGDNASVCMQFVCYDHLGYTCNVMITWPHAHMKNVNSPSDTFTTVVYRPNIRRWRHQSLKERSLARVLFNSHFTRCLINGDYSEFALVGVQPVVFEHCKPTDWQPHFSCLVSSVSSFLQYIAVLKAIILLTAKVDSRLLTYNSESSQYYQSVLISATLIPSLITIDTGH